ncbi:MAG TPA: glucosyl-3-phosphoglycerate synthase [Candidatus Binatia bacterium]|nr:glucosyl-3-phosphoglycerate synthase [Candidatus Binatia bacterium]
MQCAKVLIPVVDATAARFNLKLAASLLAPDGKILALNVVRVPEEISLSEGAVEALDSRAALEEIHSLLPNKRVELRPLVRVSHRLSEGIAECAGVEGCDLLLLPWKGSASSDELLFGRTIDRLVEAPPCNLLVARVGELARCKRILLPVRGGPYAEFALEIADRLARSFKAEITVLHCDQRFASPQFNETLYHTFIQRLRFQPKVKRLMTVEGDPKEVILQEASRHDLVIIGAGSPMEHHSFFLGPIVEQIAKATDRPLLVVKTPEPFIAWSRKHSLVRPKELSERVDQWFAENTFHRDEFAELSKLADMKRKQGLTISLGLPALNEAETVGDIIRSVKTMLFDDIPLLDEIVLIDSGSTDDTVKIARDLGIPVVVHQEILPNQGSFSGKGEALWKSLYALNGDIVAWVDTDIKNFSPGFVYGLLGPLLREPEIQYVKGFYRRPIRVDGSLVSEGGGRVTELTIRPLFNLFYPDLSGMIQPLAGEYAGRRRALECVPFFTGYGVETGLLIDLFNEFGLRAIAQVDLEERVHRNQSLPALSQMSFAIVQVVMGRLQEKNRMQLMDEFNRSMKLIQHRPRGYALEVKEIQDRERPPMATIPEYQAKFAGRRQAQRRESL